MKSKPTLPKLLTLALGFLFSASVSAQIHLQESFNGNTLPSGWTVSDQGSQACQWMIHAPFTSGFDPVQMLGSNFLFVNSDSAGATTIANETITSPVINLGGASFVYLQFQEYYRDRPGFTRMDTGYVEVFNGTVWVKVLTHLDQSTGTGLEPALTKLDISAHANPALRVRFRYLSARAFYWAIDNVVVFTPSPADVGVTSVAGVAGNCGLPASFPVTVQVVNFGSATQKNFPVSYQPNSLAVVTETFTDSVMPGDTASFTFAAPFAAPAAGAYTLSSWTSLSGDPVSTNDSARSVSLLRLRSGLAKVDFSNFTGANLNALFPGWREATGLNATLGNSGWLSSSVEQETAFGTETAKINLYQASKKDWMISPPFNPVAGTVVRFKLAVTDFGAIGTDVMGSDDSLIVKISTNCGQTWQKLIWYTKDDDLTNQLLQQAVNLSAYAGQTVLLGFYATEGSVDNTNDYDLHLDDIEVLIPSPTDLGVTQFSIPVSECGVPSSLNLKVTVYNNGTQTQTAIPVFYSVNGQTPVLETFTGSIAPGASSEFTFVNPTSFSTAGQYNLAAWTGLAGDINTINDSVKNVRVTRMPDNLSINTFTGFTGFNLSTVFPGWKEQNGLNPTGTTSNWESATVGQTTALGSATARVNLFGNTRREWLVSAPFNPTAGMFLKFKVAVTDADGTLPSTMGSDDSVSVKVTTNCGQTWTRIKSYTSANALTNQLTGQMISLAGYEGQTVRIAFFATEGTVNNTNDFDFHVDDIEVLVPSPTDVGVTQITVPGSECGVPASFNLKVSVYNNGNLTQTSIPVSYSINGQTPVSETFAGSLAPGAISEFTFANPIALASPGLYTISAWTTLMGDVFLSNDSVKNARVLRMPANFATNTFTAFTGGNLSTVSPGWKEQTGQNPTGTTSAWTTSATAQTSALGSQTAKINLFGNTLKEWLVSAPFNPIAGMVVKFKVAVTNTDLATADIMGSDDSVNVMVTTNCGQTWTRLRSFIASNNLSNQLTGQVVSLAGYEGQNLRIGFFATEGTVNDANNYDFHVDDIEVLVPSPTDLGVTEITAPTTACGVPASWSLRVKVYNNGTQAQTSIPVSYSINGQTPVSETFIGSLAVGASAFFTFTNPVLFTTSGNHRVSAWTVLPGDVNTINDTTHVQVTRVADNFPLTNFTGYTGGNLATVFPGWEEKDGATPTGTISDWLNSNAVQTGSLGSTTAKVNLYDINNREWIITPAFNVLPGALLKFRVAVTEYNTAATETMGTDDSVNVMVTTNCGLTWSRIKSYTVASALTNQLSDQSLSLDNFAGQSIRVAFFGTDGTVNNLNDFDFHLDDVTIFNSTRTEEMDVEEKTVLYPNPARSRVHFRLSSEIGSVSLFSQDGRCVRTGIALQEISGAGMDVSALPAGIYRVRIETTNGIEILPLMIAR